MSADPDELDTPLSNQTAGKARAGAQQPRRVLAPEQLVNNGSPVFDRFSFD